MKDKRIHYIGWYIAKGDEEAYSANIPGMLKMRYIAEKICEAGIPLKVYSLARSTSKGFVFPKRVVFNKMQLTYSSSINFGGKIIRAFDRYYKLLQFLLYIIFCTSSKDIILLYHSPAYTKKLKTLRQIFRRNVILEVEEIYGYSAEGDQTWVDKEIESILSMDNFLFVNDGMPHQFKIDSDRFAVCYGVGNIPERHTPRFNDGKIHVVYAGTIENKKLGAFTTVEAAKYLPSNYILHILGFGKSETINRLRECIDCVNSESEDKIVVYEGFKSGADLDEFLFGCHIGVSAYIMRETFSNCSLPSKITTYMCHDLAVVTGYAQSFELTPFSKGWTFYHDYTPLEIANAVAEAPILPIGFFHNDIKKMDENVKTFFATKYKEGN